MRRSFAVVLVVQLMISALFLSLFVNFAVANPFPGDIDCTMQPLLVFHDSIVRSPRNMTYNTRTINLTFVVSTNDPARADWCEYYCVLDGQSRIIAPVKVTNDYTGYSPSIAPKRNELLKLEFHTSIENLNDGSHSLFCREKYLFDMSFEGYELTPTVYFSVDATPPALRISNPDGAVFDSACLSLEFRANEPVSRLSYRLDDGEVCTLHNLFEECPQSYLSNLCYSYRIRENAISAGLSAGTHNLVLYASDSFDNCGQSEVFHFEIAEGGAFSWSFFVVFVALLSVVLVSGGLIAYLLRRKKRRSTDDKKPFQKMSKLVNLPKCPGSK